MSKTGQYFFEMQEDAATMNWEAFSKKYGKNTLSVYESIQLENEGPDYDYTEEEQYVTAYNSSEIPF